MSGRRVIHAPHGSERSCKGWHQEAAMRMLMNNLDPDVAENPDQLVVYGGLGALPEVGRRSTRLSVRCANSKMTKRSSCNQENRSANFGHMKKRRACSSRTRILSDNGTITPSSIGSNEWG